MTPPSAATTSRGIAACAPKTQSILELIDADAVSEAARRESRNREVYLPPLSTFRWWARRTGSVNSAVLAAATQALELPVLDVLDPFAGGGTIPLVALKDGHRIQARDLNPWAVAGVRQMLSLPDPKAMEAAFDNLKVLAEPLLADAYGTSMANGTPGQVIHTMRVAVGACGQCGSRERQFPYATLTLLQRRERQRPEAILACPAGHVFEGLNDRLQDCPHCDRQVDPNAFYTPRRVASCSQCGHGERLSERATKAQWEWEVVLVERANAAEREFAIPTDAETRQAQDGWRPTRTLGPIPDGAETRVLLRHGFRDWTDLYPNRQRVVTESLLTLAERSSDDRNVVAALRMAIVGTTEFAGLLSRWDRFYLKCNDATAGHRFNFSTFVPELNVWGAGGAGRGTLARRVRSLTRGAEWLREHAQEGTAEIECGDSAELPNEHDIDLVLTDPPYHDDVHYGELSLLFRAWAGLDMQQLEGEAASNAATGLNADGDSYAESLQRVFAACRRALREDGRLIFSYANHEPSAWIALFAALHQAGFFAVACVSVHSENETDFKKRGIRSCTEDLLLELSPVRPMETPQSRVRGVGFMDSIEDLFAEVGCYEGDWEEVALAALRAARKREGGGGHES